MSDSRSGLGKTVLVAAILTLAVTGLRLYGELEGWDPKYFSTEAGGKRPDADSPALVGIGWLMPIFGLVFGWKLARKGQLPARFTKAFFLCLVGLGMLVGVMAIAIKSEGMAFWTKVLLVNGVGLAAGFVALAGWPKLGLTNLGYGLLARLPIVGITWIALEKGWKVHHVGLPPFAPTDLTQLEKFQALSASQLGIWIGGTMVFGGLTGLIAAAIGKKR